MNRYRIAVTAALILMSMILFGRGSSLAIDATLDNGSEANSVVYLPIVIGNTDVAPEPQTVRASMAWNSFPPLSSRMIGDPSQIGIGGVPGCSQEIHDLYYVIGPDGRKYRTWHALWHPKGVDGIPTIAEIIAGKSDPECYFAHEHGDIPLAIAKPQTGAPMPPFGYAGLRGFNKVEDHPGFKVFTHMRGQKTGWHHPQYGWNSAENDSVLPDWDLQVTLHQGTPSLRTSVNAPGSTRATQRFHEIMFWMRDPQGRVTDVKTLGDTGVGLGVAYGCIGTIFPGANFDRKIADGCRFPSHPTMYENWVFEIDIAGVWSSTTQADVLNAMNFVVNIDDQVFKSASEEICGPETENDGCATKFPFGDPRVPALGFMGTQRNIIELNFKWRNARRSNLVCTDAYGERVSQSRCNNGDLDVIQQQVTSINFTPDDTDPMDRTGGNDMFVLAFPKLTLDPNRPYDCDELECEWRMPQGAPLGN